MTINGLFLNAAISVDALDKAEIYKGFYPLYKDENGIVSIESSADFELYFDESMQEWLCQTPEMAYIANFVIAADNYNKIMNLEV